MTKKKSSNSTNQAQDKALAKSEYLLAFIGLKEQYERAMENSHYSLMQDFPFFLFSSDLALKSISALLSLGFSFLGYNKRSSFITEQGALVRKYEAEPAFLKWVTLAIIAVVFTQKSFKVLYTHSERVSARQIDIFLRKSPNLDDSIRESLGQVFFLDQTIANENLFLPNTEPRHLELRPVEQGIDILYKNFFYTFSKEDLISLTHIIHNLDNTLDLTLDDVFIIIYKSLFGFLMIMFFAHFVGLRLADPAYVLIPSFFALKGLIKPVLARFESMRRERGLNKLENDFTLTFLKSEEEDKLLPSLVLKDQAYFSVLFGAKDADHLELKPSLQRAKLKANIFYDGAQLLFGACKIEQTINHVRIENSYFKNTEHTKRLGALYFKALDYHHKINFNLKQVYSKLNKSNKFEYHYNFESHRLDELIDDSIYVYQITLNLPIDFAKDFIEQCEAKFSYTQFHELAILESQLAQGKEALASSELLLQLYETVLAKSQKPSEKEEIYEDKGTSSSSPVNDQNIYARRAQRTGPKYVKEMKSDEQRTTEPKKVKPILFWPGGDTSADKQHIIKVKNCVKSANGHPLLFFKLPEDISVALAKEMREKAYLLASDLTGKHGIKRVKSLREIPHLKRISGAAPLAATDEIYKFKLNGSKRYFLLAKACAEGNKLLQLVGTCSKHP